MSTPPAPWIPATSSLAAGKGTWVECGEDPAAGKGAGDAALAWGGQGTAAGRAGALPYLPQITGQQAPGCQRRGLRQPYKRGWGAGDDLLQRVLGGLWRRLPREGLKKKWAERRGIWLPEHSGPKARLGAALGLPAWLFFLMPL